MLESMGVMAVAVTGDDNKSIRDRRLDDVRNGKTEVIIATQLADEGLDLPSLDCEINTSAGKDKGKARQRVGRTLRIGGKKPVVFEIVDSAEFKNQWQQRRKSYQQEYGNCVISVEPISVQDAIDEMEKVDCEVGQNLDRRLP
jgi:superfamily II DNA or RNA helicase